MMKPADDTSLQIAQLRISLDHVTPKVVRVLAVPFRIRLDRLHQVFQAALGWSDSHLYMIQVRGFAWGPPEAGGFYDDLLPASRFTLADLAVDTGSRTFKYYYDFGDGWRCSVKIQNLTAAAPIVSYPLLLSASGRTPPEDIGGPPGYEDYLLALCDPYHERRPAYGEAYGLDFDPAVIDVAGIDRAMAQLIRKPARLTRNRRSPQPPQDLQKTPPKPSPKTPSSGKGGKASAPRRKS